MSKITNERVIALAQFLKCAKSKIKEVEDYTFMVNKEEYLVLTNDEADEKWEEELDHYIEDCLEIPEHLKNYFDEKKWKDDARYDGRGHSLNRYDGVEESEIVNNTEYFIYRQN